MAILTHWRILAALLVAGILIAAGYVFALNGAGTGIAEASTETELLQAIAKKDSDGDGLPDWEEALYGTNPHMVDSKSLGMSDGEAVAKGLLVPQAALTTPSTSTNTSSSVADYGLTSPGASSLTAGFSQMFFSRYLVAKQQKNGAELTPEESDALVQQTVTDFAATIAPTADFKKASDLKVEGSGVEALRAFAVSVEAVLASNKARATKSEYEYLSDYLQKSDPTGLPHIAAIGKAYEDTAAGLAMIPVPQELAKTHLDLVNALYRVGAIDQDLARADNDPLAAMFALGQYPNAVLALGQSFIGVYKTYSTAGIVYTPGQPGAGFVNVVPDIAAEQKASGEMP